MINDWEHDDNDQLISGDFTIWEQGTGIWYLDQLNDYYGHLTVSEHRSESEAMAAAEILEGAE